MKRYVVCKKRVGQRKGYVSIALVTSAFLMLTMISAKMITAKAAEEDFDKNYQKKYIAVIVERNETVWSIAEEMLSDGYSSIYELIEEIAFINQLDYDYTIKTGTELIVPYYEQTIRL